MLDKVGETQVLQETREVLLGSQDTGENDIRLSSPGRRGRSRYEGHDPRGEEIQKIQNRQGILFPKSIRGGAPAFPVEPGVASLDTRRGEKTHHQTGGPELWPALPDFTHSGPSQVGSHKGQGRVFPTQAELAVTQRAVPTPASFHLPIR